MYGLQNRDQLDPVVAAEFDALISRLKALILLEHNEDGTHNTTDTTNNPNSGLTHAQTLARISMRG